MTTTTYQNSFHRPDAPDAYGPARYETDARPTAYRGLLIFERIRGRVWDVVQDGVCVRQMGGLNGAKYAVDVILDGHTPWWWSPHFAGDPDGEKYRAHDHRVAAATARRDAMLAADGRDHSARAVLARLPVLNDPVISEAVRQLEP